MKIYLRINHTCDDHYNQDVKLCQTDTSTLQHMASSWSLELNQEKCTAMWFQRKSSMVPPPHWSCFTDQAEIPLVQSPPDLDMLVESNLKFHQHSVCKFRKMGGKASLTEKIYASSENQNYIHTIVLSLSNRWPSNKSINVRGIYAKTMINGHYPLSFHNVHKISWSIIKMISDSIISSNSLCGLSLYPSILIQRSSS